MGGIFNDKRLFIAFRFRANIVLSRILDLSCTHCAWTFIKLCRRHVCRIFLIKHACAAAQLAAGNLRAPHRHRVASAAICRLCLGTLRSISLRRGAAALARAALKKRVNIDQATKWRALIKGSA